jgi:hypothetical protein
MNFTKIIENIVTNFKSYAIGFLLLFCLGQFLYHDMTINALENEKLELRNEIAKQSLVIQEKDSSYSRLSQVLLSEKELQKLLKTENGALQAEIKKAKEKIAYLMSITIKPDTVFIDSSKAKVIDSIAYISGYKKPFKVSGEYSIKDSITRNLSVLMDPFKILAVETALENDFFKARMKLTDMDGIALPGFDVYKFESYVGGIGTGISTKDYTWDIGLGGTASLYELSLGLFIKWQKNTIIPGYKLFDDRLDLNKIKWYEKIQLSYYRTIFQF